MTLINIKEIEKCGSRMNNGDYPLPNPPPDFNYLTGGDTPLEKFMAESRNARKAFKEGILSEEEKMK